MRPPEGIFLTDFLIVPGVFFIAVAIFMGDCEPKGGGGGVAIAVALTILVVLVVVVVVR